MEKFILISFLLVSCVAGLPVEKEEGSDLYSVEYFSRFSLSDRPQVLDDDDNLVDIDFEDDIIPEELTDENIGKRVIFTLFTSPKDKGTKVDINDARGLKRAGFDPKKPTRFVTHGWMNSGRSSACTLIRDAYLDHSPCNVFVIDWSNITFRPYVWASNQVLKVAIYCGQFMNYLINNGMDPAQVTMAGHSLGAHVVGLAARNCNSNIQYVAGLDPALPNFYLTRPGSRISESDAEYVEIIHTNAGLLGFLSAIGDADFYPNGGFKQAGCGIIMDMGGACSHARAYKYFAESITKSKAFPGTKCDSYSKYTSGKCKRQEKAFMGGLKTVYDARDSFYLQTQTAMPYGKGK